MTFLVLWSSRLSSKHLECTLFFFTLTEVECSHFFFLFLFLILLFQFVRSFVRFRMIDLEMIPKTGCVTPSAANQNLSANITLSLPSVLLRLSRTSLILTTTILNSVNKMLIEIFPCSGLRASSLHYGGYLFLISHSSQHSTLNLTVTTDHSNCSRHTVHSN